MEAVPGITPKKCDRRGNGAQGVTNMKTRIKILLILIATITAAAYYANSKFGYEPDIVRPVTVEIPQNTSVNGVVDIFNDKQMLLPGWFFKLAARAYVEFGGKVLYAGKYTFTPGITNCEVLEKVLSGGKLHTVRVTFPEGINLKEFASILKNKLKLNPNEFLFLAHSDSLLKAYGIKTNSLETNSLETNTLEGYLFPDTYDFFTKVSVEEVIGRLIAEGNEIWTSENINRAKQLGMSRHEILTLASIIESETSVAGEMERISGVYHNRLRKGWLLQADPTVQYAIGSKRRLSSADLKVNNPYNTYKYAGLPPGPINSPGKSAILAALNPESHSYFYFCAVGDGKGSHNFARSIEGHNVNKARFKRNIRSRK